MRDSVDQIARLPPGDDHEVAAVQVDPTPAFASSSAECPGSAGKSSEDDCCLHEGSDCNPTAVMAPAPDACWRSALTETVEVQHAARDRQRPPADEGVADPVLHPVRAETSDLDHSPSASSTAPAYPRITGMAQARALGVAAVKTQWMLWESIELISRLTHGAPDAAAASRAFGGLRRGVIHASSSTYAESTKFMLDELEPKDVVLKFLVQLYLQKKMYQRQIADIWQILLKVDSWIAALSDSAPLSTELPRELHAIFEDALAKTKAVQSVAELAPAVHSAPEVTESPVALPDATGALVLCKDLGENAQMLPTDDEVRAAVEAAKARLPQRIPLDFDGTTTATSRLLNAGRDQIIALGYSAANTDGAVTAFEAFRRAVLQIVRTPSREQDNLLEQFDPKLPFLKFLVDLGDRKRQYALRIAGTLRSLMEFDSWLIEANSDASVHASVLDLIGSVDRLKRTGPCLEEALAAEGCPIFGRTGGLEEAAAEEPQEEPPGQEGQAALQRGQGEQQAVGTLHVRVIAGHNLVMGSRGMPDPYVQIALENLMTRTEAVHDCLNPWWCAGPFLFAVSSLEAMVRFQVRDQYSQESLGILDLRAVDVPAHLGLPSENYFLTGVPRGQLELQLAFVPGVAPEGQGYVRESIVAAAVSSRPASIEMCHANTATLPQKPHEDTPRLARSRSAMSLAPGIAQETAVGPKGQWMYADVWNISFARLDPMRWSKQMREGEMIQALEKRPEKHKRRPVLVRIAGMREQKCSNLEQVHALFRCSDAHSMVAPIRHLRVPK